MSDDQTQESLTNRRVQLAQQMVLNLPVFGRWASTTRDFETPYGKAGIRQLEVLYILRHNLAASAHTATDIADHFQIQRSVVTRILAKLEANGYITRSTDPGDGRVQNIAITEIGRNLSDFVEKKYFQEMQAALGPVDEADMLALERSMAIFRTVAQNLGYNERFRTSPDRDNDTPGT